MSYRFTIITAALLLTTAFIGSAAYTSYQADRDATIQVDADSTNGYLKLADNETGSRNIVAETNGKLAIDLSSTSDNELAPNATLVVGNTTDAKNSSAFNITNAGSASRTVTVKFVKDGAWADPDSSTDNIQFAIYNDANTRHGIAKESENTVTFTVAAGETVHVVMTIKTHGTTTASELSGTLEIKAE